MGFLKLFKRTKTTIDVSVAPLAVLPGATVDLQVAVGGELDDKGESVKAGVRCVHTYKQEVRDDDGTRVVKTKETIHEDLRDLAGGSPRLGSFTATVQVPGDAVPTAEGAVEWEAVAVVGRRRGLDVTGEAPFTVLATPERNANREQLVSVAHGAPMGFDGVRRRVRTGEQVTGELIVAPDEDAKASEIRVRLVRRRVDSDEVLDDVFGNTTVDVGGYRLSFERGGLLSVYSNRSTVKEEQEVDLQRLEGGELPGGRESRFPFTLTVPDDAPPSLTAPHTVIHWQVEGIVARRLGDDYEATIELNVYNAPAPA